jgi:hypothetical protein
MAITEQQLSARIKAALDFNSDNPEVDIPTARQQLADDIASAVNDFVVSRTVAVTGVQSGSGAVEGTINAD